MTLSFIDPRLTERRNPRTASIDLASPAEIVELMNAEDRSVPEAVATQRDAIARAKERLDRLDAGGPALTTLAVLLPLALANLVGRMD